MTMSETYRVLHVLSDLQCNGSSTWLYSLLRYINPERFRFHLLVRDNSEPHLARRFESFGAVIHAVPGVVDGHRLHLRHIHRVYQTMAAFGPYQAIHCHESINSGPFLVVAKRVGIPIRIISAQNISSTGIESILKSGARWLKKRLMWAHATHGFAVSSVSAADHFGDDWTKDPRWQTFFPGVDLEPLTRERRPKEARAALGIPEQALVVGHVGRFVPYKNHKKVVAVFTEVARRLPQAHLLLVGDGPLRKTIGDQLARRRLSERVHITGFRPDAVSIMNDVMDVFLFPSHREGLGMALVEAQAAGLPCVISDTVPRDTIIDRSRVQQLALSKETIPWANAVVKAAVAGRQPFSRTRCSRFDIEQNVQYWEALYSNGAVGSFYK